jgi:hypothetical protein
MLGSLLSAVVNTEEIVYNTIKGTLEDLCDELDCSFEDLFVMIKPNNKDCEHNYFVYRLENKVPKFVREIKLKEILNSE